MLACPLADGIQSLLEIRRELLTGATCPSLPDYTTGVNFEITQDQQNWHANQNFQYTTSTYCITTSTYWNLQIKCMQYVLVAQLWLF